MSKHTLGPWSVESVITNKFCPDTGAPLVRKFHYIHGSEEKYLLGLSDTGGNTEDNARLIAAAPEMLEALKLIYHAYTCGTGCDVDAMEEVVSKAHAAIAKAEGLA